MTRAFAALAALTLTGACGTPVFLDTASTAPPVAVPVVQPPEVRLIAAIEDRGCMLNADNVGEVLLAANLTQAELREITPTLAAAGRVEVAGDGQIRVLTDRCI